MSGFTSEANVKINKIISECPELENIKVSQKNQIAPEN